ncbi:hypothetical protein ABPG72_009309 [Tetrahymena utriculariae]
MDQLNEERKREDHQIFQSSIQFSCQDKSYSASLKIINYRIEISLELEAQSHLLWKEQFSIDQSYKLNNFFLQFTTLQEVYEILKNLITDSVKSITKKESILEVQFEFQNSLGKQTQFTIQLCQCEISSQEIIVKLSKKISNLETKCNQQAQLEKIIIDQQNQIDQMKNYFEQQLEMFKKQIQELKNEGQRQNNQAQFSLGNLQSNIVQGETQMIKAWISDQQIILRLIYRATVDGFQIEKIYEKCKDKRKVVFILKTKDNKRFGFYTDYQIKNYNGSYVSQNPNNIFIFSLDLKQKYISNQPNCPKAFYSCSQYFSVGPGDIFIYSNSNSCNNNCVNSFVYGTQQGLKGHELNGGNPNFTASEIEIFEVSGGI